MTYYDILYNILNYNTRKLFKIFLKIIKINIIRRTKYSVNSTTLTERGGGGDSIHSKINAYIKHVYALQ